jgi:hypothetical protein
MTATVTDLELRPGSTARGSSPTNCRPRPRTSRSTSPRPLAGSTPGPPARSTGGGQRAARRRSRPWSMRSREPAVAEPNDEKAQRPSGAHHRFSNDRPAMGWEPLAYLHRVDVKPAWHGGGRACNFVLPTQQGTGHPTAKPPQIAEEWVRRFTAPGDTVLDPFAGTGPVVAAAKRLGRRVIASESSERWCEAIANRVSTVVRPAEDTLFGGVA